MPSDKKMRGEKGGNRTERERGVSRLVNITDMLGRGKEGHLEKA